MKTLRTQKRLAAQILGVGKGRIRFDPDRIDEIRESLTKDDIRGLIKEKAITLRKLIKRKQKIRRKKSERGVGRIRKKLNKRKQRYVKLIRKLRKFLKILKSRNVITNKEYWDLRKQAKAGRFWSKRYLKEYLKTVMKKNVEVGLKSETAEKKPRGRKTEEKPRKAEEKKTGEVKVKK